MLCESPSYSSLWDLHDTKQHDVFSGSPKALLWSEAHNA